MPRIRGNQSRCPNVSTSIQYSIKVYKFLFRRIGGSKNKYDQNDTMFEHQHAFPQALRIRVCSSYNTQQQFIYTINRKTTIIIPVDMTHLRTMHFVFILQWLRRKKNNSNQSRRPKSRDSSCFDSLQFAVF